MVTLSRESRFIEHDGTSQLGSGVRVSLESLSIEHDETSQLGAGVRVSHESWSIEHDETTCVMRYAHVTNQSRCHVCAGKVSSWLDDQPTA